MTAAVKTAATKATIKAVIKPAMKAAIKETITIPEAKAATKTKPGAGADEDVPGEPFRGVIAVRSTGVRVITVIAIGADGRWAVVIDSWTVIDGPSKSEADPLGMRVRSREERDTKTNAE
jgi:hypothetical protein